MCELNLEATYNVTIKFTMKHKVNNPEDVLDPHDIAQHLCDELTTDKSVVCYDIVETWTELR